ncbi:Pentatricopeptide repeat-containing protein, chloroplastic, partial [Symbiodinium microadriaticum]
AGQWLRAGQHLDTSRQQSPQGSPDVVAANVAIGAFGERWQAAAHIFAKLWSWKVADRVSFNTLIRSCRDPKTSWSWAWALRLLEQSRAVRSRDVVSYSSALHASARSARSASKDWRMGVMLLRDLEVELLQPDVVLWSAAVNSQARSASWSTALFLLERLPAHSAQPNMQTFGAAMAAFDTGEKGQEWQMSLALSANPRSSLALAFFSELGQERKLDIFSFGAALSACDRACLWEHALSILAELPARKLRANTVTCNTAISTCAKAGRWQVALQLLADTIAGTLDVISFNSALAASARAEEWRPALHLLSELPARRLQATSSSCNSAIMACVGSWRWALGVLSSVPSGPDKVSFNAALRACEAQAGRWKETLRLLSDFRAASHQPEATRPVHLQPRKSVITFSTGISTSQAAS